MRCPAWAVELVGPVVHFELGCWAALVQAVRPEGSLLAVAVVAVDSHCSPARVPILLSCPVNNHRTLIKYTLQPAHRKSVLRRSAKLHGGGTPVNQFATSLAPFQTKMKNYTSNYYTRNMSFTKPIQIFVLYLIFV